MVAPNQLLAAGRIYSLCARLIESKLILPGQPNATESERLIALGIASDWTRRAASLQPLTYTNNLLTKSNRASLITELVRFNFTWSGINALFARKSILDLLGTPTSISELDKFRLLYTHSNISVTKINAYENTFHNILNMLVTTRLPGIAAGTPVTTLHSLHFKYTPIEMQTKGVGKTIQSALSIGNLASLDLPLIIYATRNWSVHGGIIDSSFRGVPKFRSFINTINEAIAEIHLGFATTLHRLL